MNFLEDTFMWFGGRTKFSVLVLSGAGFIAGMAGVCTAEVAANVTPPGATEKKKETTSMDTDGQKMVVKVVDKATGKPLAGAKVQVMNDDKKADVSTDASGMAVVQVPAKVRYVRILAKCEKYVGMFRQWHDEGVAAMPKVCVFQLEKGISIGGVVNDPNGAPLSGVRVSVHTFIAEGKDPAAEALPGVSEELVTAKDGRWRCDTVPAEMGRMGVSFEHAQYQSKSLNPREILDKGLADANYVVVLERGTRLHGVVRKADGTPVKGATVLRGPDRALSGSTRKVKTDEQGRFEFASVDEWDEVVTATMKRFAPDLKAIPTGDLGMGMELVLGPEHILKGRVVDSKGRPLPKAGVVVQKWRGYRTLGRREMCDPNGRFVMNSLPGDELELSIYSPGLMEKSLTDVIADGQDHEYVLRAVLTVRGKVVDAETGKPVAKFLMIPGLARSDGGKSEMVWQNNSDWVRICKDGFYEYECQFAAMKYGIKIDAEGYLPAESREIDPNETEAVCDFALKKSAGVNGAILLPDGKPAAGVTVTACSKDSISVYNGRFMNEDRLQKTKTDANGLFHLREPGSEYGVVAVGPAGIGSATAKELGEKGTIVLKGWGAIEGQCFIGTKPAAGWQVSFNYDHDSQEQPKIHQVSDPVTTDEQGRFAFKNMMPGGGRVASVLGEARVIAAAEIIAGQTTQVKLGGGGRPVTAEIVMPADLKEDNGSMVTCTIQRRQDEQWWVQRIPWPADVNTMSAAELGKWGENFDKSPDGAKLSREWGQRHNLLRDYDVKMEDSRAVAEDVEGGDYFLLVRVRPKDAQGQPDIKAPMLAGAYVEFDMPAVGVDDVNVPFDLGKVELIRKLKEGDVAYEPPVEGAGGERMNLADYRGKTTLLVFCLGYKPMGQPDAASLSALQERFSERNDFAMVAICTESRIYPISRAYMRETGLKCPHGFRVGTDRSVYLRYSLNNTGADFGTVLIGKDGRIVALGLKGEELVKKVEEALGQ